MRLSFCVDVSLNFNSNNVMWWYFLALLSHQKHGPFAKTINKTQNFISSFEIMLIVFQTVSLGDKCFWIWIKRLSFHNVKGVMIFLVLLVSSLFLLRVFLLESIMKFTMKILWGYLDAFEDCCHLIKGTQHWRDPEHGTSFLSKIELFEVTLMRLRIAAI